MSAAEQLLVTIARCPVVTECVTTDIGHPCAGVVRHQWPGIPAEERRSRWRQEHHIPEPWLGHIEEAPILFISSNPSLSSQRPPQRVPSTPSAPFPDAHRLQAEHPAVRQGLRAPKPDWSDVELIDRFNSGFDIWMTDGIRQVGQVGTVAKPVPFWRDVKALSDALLGRPAAPGIDYALTEVVHCKSRDEVGVVAAAAECVPRYLRRVLALSPAVLLVVLGRHARQAVRAELSYPDDRILSEPMEIEGRPRRLMLLSHPAARSAARYPKRPSDADLAIVTDMLSEESRARKFRWEAGDIQVTKRPPALGD